MKRILTAVQINQICDLKKTGVPATRIASQIGVGLSTVYKVLDHPKQYLYRANRTAPAPDNAQQGVREGDEKLRDLLGDYRIGNAVLEEVETYVSDQLAAKDAEISHLTDMVNQHTDDGTEFIRMINSRDTLIRQLTDALRLAEKQFQDGVLNAPDGQWEKVVELRRGAIAEAEKMTGGKDANN